MPREHHLDPVFLWIYFIFGVVTAVDITLESPYDGFFLRDSYNKNELQDPGRVSKTFFITEPSDTYKIKAQNGPFEVQHTISRNLTDTVLSRSRKNVSLMHRSIVYNMDVSAHIVSKDISPKIPRLQVLVHAEPHRRSKVTSSSNQYWCAQVFAEVNDIELSSVCVLREKDKVCVVGLDLHKEWWTANGTQVMVKYSFSHVDQNNRCASASNSIIPEKVLSNNSDQGIVKQEISSLLLVQNERSFNEWKDQDILIDMPLETFHQSDSFEIPVRLEKNSDLHMFVMRARVRQGLRITGARTTDPSSQWSIDVDIKEHQKTGSVTAFVRDPKLYKKSTSVQDVFQWQMEVTDDMYDSRDLGRVVWSIEYERNSLAGETYPSQESKILSRINIRSRDQPRLVPVLKVMEIVNAAILTGEKQEYPLSIYTVDDQEKFAEVTDQAKCHSMEVDVLKVSSDCSSVYVDGAESRGSHNVSVIVKSGHTTAFLDIAVWIPEEMLDMQLSDVKLSRVRNWRVPRHRHRKSDNSIPEGEGPTRWSCELQRQQSIVEIYTRFYIQTHKQTVYFLGPGAYVNVTGLVKDRLRMSDTGVASLDGNIISGLEDGRTEIQLLSRWNGHVLAMREVQVSHDKVNVKQLNLQLFTHMTMDVKPSNHVPGAILATAFIDNNFVSIYQMGVVDIEVVYSDESVVPLRYISQDDYSLEVVTLDNKVVNVSLTETPYQPMVVVTGEGKGEMVQVVLKLGEKCLKKKSAPLVADTLYVDVDFSQEPPYNVQQDAHFDPNRPSDSWVHRKKPGYTLHDPSEFEKDYTDPKFSKNQEMKEPDTLVISIGNDFNDLVQKEDGAKKEPLRVKTSQRLTPLEISMYVLLAVFCVAMTVFTVNCVVFFVRYKRKQKPAKDKSEAISNANDWVWIGRATLERNSVYTRSSRTLMPEEDFNGNVNSTRPMSTGSSSSGGSLCVSSAPNSNRNSTVSTYKGSECSIRITANPLTEEGAMGGAVPEETQSEGGGPQWDYEAMGMNYNQLLDYFDNLKETNA